MLRSVLISFFLILSGYVYASIDEYNIKLSIKNLLPININDIESKTNSFITYSKIGFFNIKFNMIKEIKLTGKRKELYKDDFYEADIIFKTGIIKRMFIKDKILKGISENGLWKYSISGIAKNKGDIKFIFSKDVFSDIDTDLDNIILTNNKIIKGKLKNNSLIMKYSQNKEIYNNMINPKDNLLSINTNKINKIYMDCLKTDTNIIFMKNTDKLSGTIINDTFEISISTNEVSLLNKNNIKEIIFSK